MATIYPRERELVHGEHQLFPAAESVVEAAPRALPRHPAVSWWTRHGEMLCAIVSGVLLLTAAIVSRVTSAGDAALEYHFLVYAAFGLGFIFGAAEAWGRCGRASSTFTS